MEAPAVPVLVVDDQALFRNAAAAVVRLTPGFEMIGEAQSGEEAVERVQSLSPALVLMDINMAGMNGIDATRVISREHPGVVVVLLSTYEADDLPADAMASGAAAYVNKEEFGPDVLKRVWNGRTVPAPGD